eukprot:jgi/Mesvir1/1443/Mv14434-RA.1
MHWAILATVFSAFCCAAVPYGSAAGVVGLGLRDFKGALDGGSTGSEGSGEKHCILVGNGRSVLGSGNGKVIDSFKEIGRFNFFETAHLEADVGTLTTTWFLGEMKDPGLRRKDVNPRRVVVPVVWIGKAKACVGKARPCRMSSGEREAREKTISRVRNLWKKDPLYSVLEILPEDVEMELQTKYGFTALWPSTGLQALVYMLRTCPTVTITGYDFAHGSHEHFWEKKRKRHTLHDMHMEGKIIHRLIQEGKVVVLN